MNYRAKISQLNDVCEIQSGFTPRGRLEPTEGEGVRGIQYSDLDRENEFDPETASQYELKGKVERYLAGSGDVLFRSRGDRNTAVAIKPGSNFAGVAILPLVVLRPDQSILSPQYLAWFINQPASQRYFDGCARGTGMRMIPKADLENLEIAVPDHETQQLVVEIDHLARREYALTLELAEKKKAFTEFALVNQVRNAQPHGNGAGRNHARQKPNPAGT